MRKFALAVFVVLFAGVLFGNGNNIRWGELEKQHIPDDEYEWRVRCVVDLLRITEADFIKVSNEVFDKRNEDGRFKKKDSDKDKDWFEKIRDGAEPGFRSVQFSARSLDDVYEALNEIDIWKPE